VSATQPRGKKGSGDGGLLKLTPDWLKNPEAFERPLPEGAKDLTKPSDGIKITCKACGLSVHPNNTSCPHCSEGFRP